MSNLFILESLTENVRGKQASDDRHCLTTLTLAQDQVLKLMIKPKGFVGTVEEFKAEKRYTVNWDKKAVQKWGTKMILQEYTMSINKQPE